MEGLKLFPFQKKLVWWILERTILATHHPLTTPVSCPPLAEAPPRGHPATGWRWIASPRLSPASRLGLCCLHAEEDVPHAKPELVCMAKPWKLPTRKV